MKNLIKIDALELGNFILMCYQDVLKVMEDIKSGIEPPYWFNIKDGTCPNVYHAADVLYGVSGKSFDRAQRLCISDSQNHVYGESKLDYILAELWVNLVDEVYSGKRPTRVYPIVSEFEDREPWDSYHMSSDNLSLYKGNQLDARIGLIKFKCDTLSKELKSVWKSNVTSKDFKTVLEELEKLEG